MCACVYLCLCVCGSGGVGGGGGGGGGGGETSIDLKALLKAAKNVNDSLRSNAAAVFPDVNIGLYAVCHQRHL